MHHRPRTLLAALAFVGAASLCLGATAAHAGRPVLNPQAGVTWTNLTATSDLDIQDKGKLGYALGGQVRLGGSVYLAPGLFYQRTALEASAADTVGIGDVTDVVGTNSFYIPVHVGLNLSPPGGAIALRVYAGPTATIVTSVADNDFGIVKDDYEKTIFGGVLGAGVDLTSFTIDLNYEIGLSNVFKADDKAKQNVLRGLVGLKF